MTEEAAQLVCRQCAAEIAPGSVFCSRCGASQKGAPPAAAPTPVEETLWIGRYALRSAAHLWILAVLWLAAVAYAYFRWVEVGSGTIRIAVLVVGFAPLCWTVGRALFDKLTLRFRLTNDRLFTERGLLSRRFDELELIRVDDVSVTQTLVQRCFGVGTVTLLSTDTSSPRVEIRGILRPLEVKELVRSQVRARRARTTFLETL